MHVRTLVRAGIAAALVGVLAAGANALLLPAVQKVATKSKATTNARARFRADTNTDLQLFSSARGDVRVSAPQTLFPDTAIRKKGKKPPKRQLVIRLKKLPLDEIYGAYLVTIDGDRIDLGPLAAKSGRASGSWDIDDPTGPEESGITARDVFGGTLVVEYGGGEFVSRTLCNVPFPVKVKKKFAKVLANCDRASCVFLARDGEHGHVAVFDVPVDGDRMQTIVPMLPKLDPSGSPYTVAISGFRDQVAPVGTFEVKKNGKARPFVAAEGEAFVAALNALRASGSDSLLVVYSRTEETVFRGTVTLVEPSTDDPCVLVPIDPPRPDDGRDERPR